MTYVRLNTINDSLEVEVDELADTMAYITDDAIAGEIHSILSLAIDESLEDVDISEEAMATLHSALERAESDARPQITNRHDAYAYSKEVAKACGIRMSARAQVRIQEAAFRGKVLVKGSTQMNFIYDNLNVAK